MRSTRSTTCDAIARQDKRIAADSCDARDQVHVARERTKTIRARVHSETQVVAVRTQQQRDVEEPAAREQELARRQAREAEGRSSPRPREQEKAFIAEANALAAEDARHPRTARRGAGRDRHDAVRPGPDLAGQRARHEPVRLSLGTPARRHRHRRPVRHADPRGRVGHGRARRLDRRLRQLHLHRPRRRHGDLLRAPVRVSPSRRARRSRRAR